jgi:hypothetical protein
MVNKAVTCQKAQQASPLTQLSDFAYNFIQSSPCYSGNRATHNLNVYHAKAARNARILDAHRKFFDFRFYGDSKNAAAQFSRKTDAGPTQTKKQSTARYVMRERMHSAHRGFGVGSSDCLGSKSGMEKRNQWGLLFTLAVMSGSNCLAASDEDPVQVVVVGNAVHYTGELDDDAVAAVASLLKSSGGSIAKLVIDSGGGDVNAGMDLAEFVLASELDVTVERLCASSCANYVFPAGKSKRINPGAVVVWHGSAIQEGLEAGPTVDDIRLPEGVELSLEQKLALLEQHREQSLRYVEDAKARQRAFFGRIGIDERVTVMGQQLEVAQEWTLSVKDMARFGIRDVFAADDYGRCLPAQVRERGIQLLSLDDYPDYAATLEVRMPELWRSLTRDRLMGVTFFVQDAKSNGRKRRICWPEAVLRDVSRGSNP